MLRIVLLGGLIAGCALPAQAQSAAFVAESAPMLAPGDMVRIVVWRNADLSGEYPISGSGAIQHPLYQDVYVGGIPVPEAEARVRTFLARYQADPQFTMEPLFRVFVGGTGLARAGVYHHPPYLTLADAIRDAGGSTAPNRSLRVRVIRGDETTIVPMTDGAAELLRHGVLSGDQIIIERRPTIMGSVVSPVAAITTGLWSIYSILNATGLLDIF